MSALRRRASRAILVALVPTAGCALFAAYDFDGYQLDAGADAASDAGLDAVEEKTADAPPSADAADGACTADLANDRHNCGACGHDCVGGQCGGGVCQPWTIKTGQTTCSSCGPSGLAVAGRYLFWTVFQAQGSVWRVDLVGDGGVAELAKNQPWAYPVAADSSFVYWGTTSQVLRCVHTGCSGAPETVGTQSYNNVNGIALTDASAYWTEYGDPSDGGTPGAVWTADKSITAVPQVIAPNQVALTGIAVADAVYWLSAGTPALNGADGAVLRTGFDGGAPGVIARAQLDPQSIAEYAGRLYWTNMGTTPNFQDGAVMTCARDACVPTVLAANQAGAQGVAVDASGAYWANEFGGAVMHCDDPIPTACQPKALANAQAPWAIATDDKSVFWTDVNAGTVVRLAKPLR
jgi:hypothetical protein